MFTGTLCSMPSIGNSYRFPMRRIEQPLDCQRHVCPLQSVELPVRLWVSWIYFRLVWSLDLTFKFLTGDISRNGSTTFPPTINAVPKQLADWVIVLIWLLFLTVIGTVTFIVFIIRRNKKTVHSKFFVKTIISRNVYSSTCISQC